MIADFISAAGGLGRLILGGIGATAFMAATLYGPIWVGVAVGLVTR